MTPLNSDNLSTNQTMKVAAAFAIALVLHGTSVVAQTAADSTAIRQTALDYIQGWYSGDAARMERALHPELAKRIVRSDSLGRFRLDQQSAMTLVQNTRTGGGKDTPAADRHDDVRILDVYRNAASVRIDASYWIDYLQVAKWRGRWVIVNVLWEAKPNN